MRIGRWLLPLAAALALAPAAAPARQVAAPATAQEPAVETPAELYGELFRAVQDQRIFADSKTFADAVPIRSPKAIMQDYYAAELSDEAALRRFVRANFQLPDIAADAAPARFLGGVQLPLREHIALLWGKLARTSPFPRPDSSTLALPDRYVVPGGRFRELYYWDSYFTMLGLKADGRGDLVEAMIANFMSLVDRYGHVPNGTRTYYLSRSQPPMLYLMMALSEQADPAELRARVDALRREHRYWMGGVESLPEGVGAAGHVVRMPDGSILNRYWDARDLPREESWREDAAVAAKSGRDPIEVWHQIRAAAESGWDFSSRWLADGKTLETIDTGNLVPADLNALLYGLERAIAERCSALADAACAQRFDETARKRRAAIERWLWDDAGGRYGDWDWRQRALRPGLTAATAYPLFTGVSEGRRAARVAATIDGRLIAPGGLRTTLARTGQQWDAPNGWAPLQWIAVAGLRRTGHDAVARRIGERFLATVEREYRASGKLVEKYDVEEIKPGGGGEYPLQDGFGWTNGVTRALQELYE